MKQNGNSKRSGGGGPNQKKLPQEEYGFFWHNTFHFPVATCSVLNLHFIEGKDF